MFISHFYLYIGMEADKLISDQANGGANEYDERRDVQQ